jgi:hypothetical protein
LIGVSLEAAKDFAALRSHDRAMRSNGILILTIAAALTKHLQNHLSV